MNEFNVEIANELLEEQMASRRKGEEHTSAFSKEIISESEGYCTNSAKDLAATANALIADYRQINCETETLNLETSGEFNVFDFFVFVEATHSLIIKTLLRPSEKHGQS